MRHPPLHLRTADHFELDNISPVQVCVSSETDTPGWGNHGCPACRRGLARGGQAEVIEPVIEGRSTIRHAVYRAPLQRMHADGSAKPPHPWRLSFSLQSPPSLTDVTFLLR